MTYRVEFLHGPDPTTLDVLLMDFKIPFGSHVVVEGEGLTPHTISWEGGTWTRDEQTYRDAPAGTPVKTASGSTWVMIERAADDDALLSSAFRKILTSNEYVEGGGADESVFITLDGTWTECEHGITIEELDAMRRVRK